MPLTLNDANSKPTYARQGGSCTIFGALLDAAKSPIVLANLMTLTLSLKDKATNTTINSRTDVDVLNANNAVVGSDGTFAIKLNGADNPIVNMTATPGTQEVHFATLKWTWDDGTPASPIEGVEHYLINVESG